jgi:hypothetical protein
MATTNLAYSFEADIDILLSISTAKLKARVSVAFTQKLN